MIPPARCPPIPLRPAIDGVGKRCSGLDRQTSGQLDDCRVDRHAADIIRQHSHPRKQTSGKNNQSGQQRDPHGQHLVDRHSGAEARAAQCGKILYQRQPLRRKARPLFNLNNQPLAFLANGYHNLKVTACDDVGNCSSDSVEINLVGGNEKINTTFTAALTWPSSGLALGEGEFPAHLKFQLSNPGQVGRVDVYTRLAGGQDSWVGTISSIAGSEVPALVRSAAIGNLRYFRQGL